MHPRPAHFYNRHGKCEAQKGCLECDILMSVLTNAVTPISLEDEPVSIRNPCDSLCRRKKMLVESVVNQLSETGELSSVNEIGS
jgi:hypothetical protein